jgi:DeoR family fructose operon transcriptional repressor
MTPYTLNARQQEIMEMLNRDGEVKISELKEKFTVAEMTLRRDLEKLEITGSVRRTFGGAILIGKDVALQDRTGVHTLEKMRIGKMAAKRIQPGDSVFIDGGSTTLQVARYIPAGYNVTIVTNAINVAAELINKQITTIVTGGTLLEKTASLVGPIAVDTISRMAFDRVFLGTTGFSLEHGFSNSNVYEAEIKGIAIQRASDVNIVMDHSKWWAKELFSFAPLEAVHHIITDKPPEPRLEAILKDTSVKLLSEE